MDTTSSLEELQKYLSTPEFQAKSEQVKKARKEGKGGSLHTKGAKSQGMIAREL
ncbi:hypothetical protein HAX54_013246, partial [Datura stramonium]|nr:hypothetical protein [Datura stramonium]